MNDLNSTIYDEQKYKIPVLLTIIIWINYAIVVSQFIGAFSKLNYLMDGDFLDISALALGTIGGISTYFPFLICSFWIKKRYNNSILFLSVVFLFHALVSYISYLKYGVNMLLYYAIILLIMGFILIYVHCKRKYEKWLNIKLEIRKEYKSVILFTVFVLLGIIFLLSTITSSINSNKNSYLTPEQSFVDDTVYVGGDEKLSFFIDLSSKVKHTSNGYIVPMLIKNNDKEVRFARNVYIDVSNQLFCFDNCDEDDSFRAYIKESPIGNTIRYIEGEYK